MPNVAKDGEGAFRADGGADVEGWEKGQDVRFVCGYWDILCSSICLRSCAVVVSIGKVRCGSGLRFAEDDVDSAAGGVVKGEEMVLGVVVIDCDDYTGELNEADGVVEVVNRQRVLVDMMGCCSRWERSPRTRV